MKTMKRFVALALSLVLLASLLPTVSVPAVAATQMNPTITDGVLTWQPMDGATTYAVNWYIDNWTSGSGYITETSFDLQAAMDARISCYTGEYCIRVVAYRSAGSYLCEEQVQFYYHSTVPCLNTPAVWFEGTTVCWYPVENADYFEYGLRCSTDPTSYYGAPYVKRGRSRVLRLICLM